MSRMAFADANGVTIHYTEEGCASGLPLVFINSLGTDMRIWDAVIPHFAEYFRIIRHDKRGHGLSDAPPGPYSIRDHSDDLDRLLNFLKVETAILVGISIGGVIALDYTLRYPGRVKALILCDTALKIGSVEFWNNRIEAIQKRGMEYLTEAIIQRWFVADFAERYPAEHRGYYNMLSRMPAEGYAASCAALRDADLHGAAAGIEQEALVLCGTEDVATSPDMARELAESLKHARFELVENAAHLICVEQPEIVASKMQQFFEEIGYGR